MTQVQVQDLYAPPQAHVEDVQDPLETGELARRWTRLLAALIDMGIGLVVYVAVSLLVFRTPWFQPDRGNLWIATLISVGSGFVGFVILHGWTLVQRGQTLGKVAMRIRIVMQDGTRASGWRLIGLRYGIGYLVAAIPYAGGVYGLVDGLFIFGKSRRCLHDYIAGTVVVTA